MADPTPVSRVFFPLFAINMPPITLSERLKKANSDRDNLDTITKKVSSSLNLDEESCNHPIAAKPADHVESDEEDWEKLADKELHIPVEPVKKPVSTSSNTSILELYDFDPHIQMHQLVKEFSNLIDPAGAMPFRPKMVNQSLILTFNNPKHGM